MSRKTPAQSNTAPEPSSRPCRSNLRDHPSCGRRTLAAQGP
jgi:hypothetical protein